MPQYPPIQVVDEYDQPVRGASLDEIHKLGLVHRVVHILVEDEEGRLLLQKRGSKVAAHPNRWDYSAAGHVDEGETYKFAAKRELEEEIGLSGFSLTKVHHIRHIAQDGWRTMDRFVTLYRVVVPVGTPFQIDKSEVADARWFTLTEIRELLEQEPDNITPSLSEDLRTYYENHGDQTAG